MSADRVPAYGDAGMRRFVDARTGRLAMPEPDPVQSALRARRERWTARFLLVFAVLSMASSTALLVFMSKPYLVELRLALMAGIVLSFGVVGIALWTITHVPKRPKETA
jgi:hypothetical protein